MRKMISVLLLAAMALSVCAGCQSGGGTGGSGNGGTVSGGFEKSKEITVISREEGSGTRGAFIELFGIEQKGEDGSKKDLTSKEAIIAKQTDVMMNNVAGDKFTIGYISLGSLNDTVKAVQIEGVTPTSGNVKSGTYPIARPFNIATKGEASGLTKDFIDYIMSAEGQEIVGKSYISIDDSAHSYAGNKPSGKIVVAGSSSVTPIMEKLKEGYLEVNTNAEIEIQMSDSSAGIIGAIDGTCDIGMASRELKESELEELKAIQIALDGIAVIVNKENPSSDFTIEQIRNIFTGETVVWDEVIK